MMNWKKLFSINRISSEPGLTYFSFPYTFLSRSWTFFKSPLLGYRITFIFAGIKKIAFTLTCFLSKDYNTSIFIPFILKNTYIFVKLIHKSLRHQLWKFSLTLDIIVL